MMKNKIKNTGTAKITIGSDSYDLPIYEGSIGAPGIDVRALYKQSGHFTFDPGYTSTCSTESQITYIDGGKGQLLYRGYPIEQLAEQSTFLEVAYLLINGDLPNAKQSKQFTTTITNHTMLHDQIESFFHGYRRDAHPMAMLCGTVGALSGFYHDDAHTTEDEARDIAIARLISKMPTLAARAYKYSIVNIAAKSALMPEYVQADCNGKTLSQAVLDYLDDPAKHAKARKALRAQTQIMKGEGGLSYSRAAKAVLSFLHRHEITQGRA